MTRLQNLERNFPIIDLRTGAPTEYFIRLFQVRGNDQMERVPGERTIATEGGLQGGGDLTDDRTLSLTDTGVTPGTYANATVTVDAKGRITAIVAGAAEYPVPFGFTTPPAASEAMLLHTFTRAVIFPDDWAGAQGNVTTAPGSTFVFTIKKRTAAGVTTTVGTITVSATGVSAFATAGTTVSFAAGDMIIIEAQASTDSIANAAFTLVGE